MVNNHEISTPCSHSQSSGSDVVEEISAREASDLDTETSSIKCGRIMEDQETAMLVKNNNVAPFFGHNLMPDPMKAFPTGSDPNRMKSSISG